MMLNFMIDTSKVVWNVLCVVENAWRFDVFRECDVMALVKYNLYCVREWD